MTRIVVKRFIVLVLTICNITILYAQKTCVINGYINDSVSNEVLIGATVFNTNAKNGTTTNNYGYYCLAVKEGMIELNYSYIGHNSAKKVFYVKKDTVINLKLSINNELTEVIINGQKENYLVNKNLTGIYDIDLKSIKKQPILLGETDILKSIQLIPGFQAGKEGTAGLNVRGGTPDQNLILLDGIPVYNVNHLFGFFSLFNADAINSVKVIKGGMPAQYGGRLSSVIDIYLKEGNSNKLSCNGSIGLISSKITIESPILNKKASFMFSGRRTYIDLLTKPFVKNTENDLLGNYYFYDLYSKLNYTFSENNRIFISVYTGRDKTDDHKENKYTHENFTSVYNDWSELGWGNITTALRWNYLISKKLFINTTFTFSDYDYLNAESSGGTVTNIITNETQNNHYSIKNSSGIKDFCSKLDVDYLFNQHSIKIGSNFTHHVFNPGINLKKVNNDFNQNLNIDTVWGNKQIYANEFSAFVKDYVKINSNIFADFGMHYNYFAVNKKEYHSIEPRIILAAQFGKYSINSSYTANNQNIHLLTNTSIGLPTDLWLPATEKIRPQKSKQLCIGVAYQASGLAVNIDAYYKKMVNIIEYREGAFYGLENSDWQELVESGTGKAYGMELLIQKSISKFDFYLSYCVSKSTRQFENISFGMEYPYRYDRRHNIAFTTKYQINPNIDISMAWYYATGDAITLSTQKVVSGFLLTSEHYNSYGLISNDFVDENKIKTFIYNRPYTDLQIEYFEHRNNYRMPSYHRMDIAVNFQKQRTHYFRTLSMGLYNVYNRQNAFYYYYDVNKTNPFQATIKLKQVTLFPILPSISYSIKF